MSVRQSVPVALRTEDRPAPPRAALIKEPTGIAGLDEILGGGLPQGRPTLVCGRAGCGKTLLGMEFLCRGALEYDEAGVFITFEEKASELVANFASMGFDLEQLQADGRLVIDYLPADPEETIETGPYDLEGLFLRIAAAVSSVGAKRIVIDTMEVLFGALKDTAVIRAELKRLFAWTKDQGLTAIVTAESGGEGLITRNGIDEYVSDCVILLDNRITEEHSTRRLRILKYRGSSHGTDEYPFLISKAGFSVLPISSLGLAQPVSTERISTGVARLDATLSGGIYRGSSALVSGAPGTGKTTFAAHVAEAACRRGSKTLYISYEESPPQLERNMEAAGIALRPWREKGLLQIASMRPTFLGLEAHLMWLEDMLNEFQPALVIADPVTSYLRSGSRVQTASMLLREIDLLKSRGITGFFTALTQSESAAQTEIEISSLMDTWLKAETTELNGEQNRVLYIIKSRGTAHSNQLAEFRITDHGIELLEPYIGPAGVLTGSARLAQEALDQAMETESAGDFEDEGRALKQRGEAIEAQIAVLRADYAADKARFSRHRSVADAARSSITARRVLMNRLRWGSERRTDPESEREGAIR